MNFPSARAPRMMITIFAEPTDIRPDIRVRFVVLVVPHQITGHANFVRLTSGRDETVVRQSEERGQLLNSNAAPIKQRLSARRDFTNDRRRVAGLRGMVRRSR